MRSGAASPAAASMCSTVGKICGIAGVMVAGFDIDSMG